MAQSRNRKKHHSKQTPPAPKKAARRKSINVRIMMMLFFGVAGLAIGYLWSGTNTGIISGGLIGMLGGLLLSLGFVPATENK